MADEAKVIGELEEMARERARFSKYLDDNKEFRSPDIFENFPRFQTGLPSVASNTVYSDWKKKSGQRRAMMDKTKQLREEIKLCVEQIGRLDAEISNKVSEQFTFEATKAEGKLSALASGKLSLEQARALQSAPIHYVPGTVSDKDLKELASLDYDISQKIIKLETEQLKVLGSQWEQFLRALEALDYKKDTIPPRPKIDWHLFQEVREEEVGRRVERLGIYIELRLAELHKLKQRRDIGLKEEGERFIQKHKQYKDFSIKLEEISPFDVDLLLQKKPDLVMDASAFYEPEGEQAQKIKRKLEEYDQKINQKIAQLRKDAAALRTNDVFSELQEHSSQLVSYFKLLEKGTERLPDRRKKLNTNELREAFERQLEKKKKNFMKQHEGATEKKWEMFKESAQGILEKEIRKLERLEETLDSHMNKLVVNGTLVEFEDGTTQTVGWVRNEQLRVESEQLERIDVLERFNEKHKEFFLDTVFLMRNLEEREEHFKKRPQTPSFEPDVTQEIKALKDLELPSLATRDKIERLKVILNLQNEIKTRNREIDSQMKAARARDHLPDFLSALNKKIDELSDFWGQDVNQKAVTELATLKEALDEQQQTYLRSLAMPLVDNVPLEIFKRACQRAVLLCMSEINEDAVKNLPKEQAAEVQEQTSGLVKFFLDLLESLFGPSEAEVIKEVEVAPTENVGTEEFSQFKEKFVESVEREKQRDSEAQADKENQSGNQQNGEDSNQDTSLDM